MIGIADALADGGLVAPLVPHLTMLWHTVTPRDLDFWYEYDLALLRRCDALLRVEGRSTGADGEVVYAEELGTPVLHSLEQVTAWAQNWLDERSGG